MKSIISLFFLVIILCYLLAAQEIVVELDAGDLVERRERLDPSEDLGPHHQRASDRDAHLHAPGQLARDSHRRTPDNPTIASTSSMRSFCVVLAGAREQQRQVHVVGDRPPRQQRRLLKQAKPSAAPACPCASSSGLRPVDRAGGGRREVGDKLEQRRLSAARRSEQADELAGPDREIDTGRAPSRRC